ncbi:hypothetical protein L208DRAFT_1374301 [Tricholoma matsutake]|nr:hypothetical protein L208DRAFT_1374301 [Tricholoma matsutake 945]
MSACFCCNCLCAFVAAAFFTFSVFSAIRWLIWKEHNMLGIMSGKRKISKECQELEQKNVDEVMGVKRKFCVLDGPKLFEGDAFGGPEDYMDEDFGQNDVVLHGQLPELIDDPDDKQDDMLTAGQDAILEDGWEPEWPGASVDVTAAVQADSSDAPVDPELTDAQ